MANSERREINKQGKMFMPMNMTGSTDNEHFINVPKLIVIGLTVLATILLFSKIKGASVVVHLVVLIVYLAILQFIVRKLIFEEDYFFKAWKKTKSYKKPTPGVFWKISSISHTKTGDIVIFSDMKIGCFVKLERDTIVGKVMDNAERHYDAWSDFYKEVNIRGLRLVQLNLMEPAGKDSRIDNVAIMASASPNNAIRDLLEKEVGYIKEISRATLSEGDYLLLYDTSVTHIDSIIGEVTECISKLLDGAYADVNILKEREIYQLPKSIDNVEYFDGITAQIEVYRSVNYKVKPVMILDSIGFENKEIVKLGDGERNILTKLTSLVKDESLTFGEWTAKEALEGKLNVFNLKNKSSHTQNGETTNAESGSENKQENTKAKRIRAPKIPKKRKIKEKQIESLVDTEELDDEEDLLS